MTACGEDNIEAVCLLAEKIKSRLFVYLRKRQSQTDYMQDIKQAVYKDKQAICKNKQAIYKTRFNKSKNDMLQGNTRHTQANARHKHRLVARRHALPGCVMPQQDGQ